MRRISPCLVFLLAFLIAGSASAYTIVLKDGTKLEAREKYRVEGDKALIYLINGTLVTYDLEKIDRDRTDAANTSNFGKAVLFEDGQARTGPPPPPPPRTDSLSDLIKKRRADLRTPEQSRRSENPGESRQPGVAPVLANLKGYRDLEMVGELQEYLRSQGVEPLGVYQGSSNAQPLIIAKATSEATVFRALKVAANALLEMRARHGDSLKALELRLEASGRSNAGDFLLDPDKAHELVDGRIETSAFFVKYVEF